MDRKLGMGPVEAAPAENGGPFREIGMTPGKGTLTAFGGQAI